MTNQVWANRRTIGGWVWLALAMALCLGFAAPALGAAAEGGAHGTPNVHWIWILPFALLLGSIAICPLVNMHFWEHRYPWFAIILGSVTAVYYLFIFDDPYAKGAWLHEMQEYVSFIALLGSLYIVSGGIVIHVSRRATPTTNTTLLLVGAIIANIVGTTGAAMLLIRPYIRINRGHIKPYHIVFFIFLVANCGGCLTPIGDPPLFMGYLKGVPFFWVLKACWPMWLLACVILLVIFFIVDTREHARVPREKHDHDAGRAVEIFGFQNVLIIHLILLAVFQESMFHVLATADRPLEYLALLKSREIMMGIAIIASLKFTKPYIYERNEFTYGPIKEVAILFVGIFSTMVPALNYLNLNSDKMPLNSAGQYYYTTGVLSSVLDNAPTYLVFLETKRGSVDKKHRAELAATRWMVEQMIQRQLVGDAELGAKLQEIYRQDHGGQVLSEEELTLAIEEVRAAIDELLTYHAREVRAGKVTDSQINLAFLIGHPVMGLYLVAISLGAVFFGAGTYIGNGPNFMVKSIAESAGIQMPSFFGYAIKYSLPILLPVLIVVWVVFISGWVL